MIAALPTQQSHINYKYNNESWIKSGKVNLYNGESWIKPGVNYLDCIAKTNDPYFREYTELTLQYIMHRYWELMDTVDKKKLPNYLLKQRKLLEPYRVKQPSPIKIQKYLLNPRSHALALAKTLFDQPENLISNALRTIFSTPLHKQNYRYDLTSSFLFGPQYLGQIIKYTFDNYEGYGPMQLCEIGAGTGGITDHIINYIDGRSYDYTITDIARAYLRGLQQEFNPYRQGLNYKSWNINQPCSLTSVRKFDMIVGSNALHTSNNISKSIAHIYDSLSEGGYFILHETTHGFAPTTAIWGFIEGLWSFEDAGDRDCGPYLSVEQWKKQFDNAGFDHITTLDDGMAFSMQLFKKR